MFHLNYKILDSNLPQLRGRAWGIVYITFLTFLLRKVFDGYLIMCSPFCFSF